jgi:hypothetical protein
MSNANSDICICGHIQRAHFNPILGGKRRPCSHVKCPYAAERTADPQKAKGFIQRLIEIHCFANDTPYDISEVVNTAGDQENEELLDELLGFRNTLLIYSS